MDLKNKKNSKWVVALTGASGMKYALRLLELLPDMICEVHVVVSDAALRVLSEEEDIKTSSARLDLKGLIGKERENLFFHSVRDIGAPIASGSFRFDGMLVVPCSMSTLGAIANGVSNNLIHRAAEVVLKERKNLILVPRETPLSPIQLENMLKLSRLGVSILPAMPGFYHKPTSIDQLIDMLVMKVLDQMGLDSDLVARWGKPSAREA